MGGYYSNNRKAIRLIDGDSGEPIATATVNLPAVELAENEVVVKDYSENQGMYVALLDAGIVHPELEMYDLTFPGTRVAECRLTDKALNTLW